ncbi:MAG: hypothetical protein ACRC1H_05565 [Caldilineaceae bacterium]
MRILLSPTMVSARRLSLFALGLLAAFFCLVAPQVARAQDPLTSGDTVAIPTEEVKPCTSCHEDEADSWMASPHALTSNPDTGEAAASCTTCHGDYVRGHPDEALTPLRADSNACKTCHAGTFTQWENSTHGAEGVQCISCHQPHSQEMRLTDERQCTACHQESLDDPMHSAHWQAETACTDCHMAQVSADAALAMAHSAGASDGAALMAVLPSTNHDFVSVSADNCLGCHAEDVSSNQQTSFSTTALTARDTEEALSNTQAELESAEQRNYSLTIFSLANLGFGLGIGGILGIVFMVAFVRFGNPSPKKGADHE